MKTTVLKRLTAFVCAMSLCFAMASCGKSNPEDITESEANEILEEYDNDKKGNGGYENPSATPESSSKAEIQEVDPFESLTVTFEGASPFAVAKLKDNEKFGFSVCSFTADKTEKLKNGDTIKVTAACKAPDKFNFTQTEKEYKVEGLPSYITKLADVPQELMDNLKKQAEDMLIAEGAKWKNDNKIVEKKFIGNYFLIGKEGIDLDRWTANDICLVYKVKTSMNGVTEDQERDAWKNHEEFYYAEFTLSNVTIMPDGKYAADLSKFKRADNEAKSDYCDLVAGVVHDSYKYKGYRDLDSCFNDHVASMADNYTYENTVDDKA